MYNLQYVEQCKLISIFTNKFHSEVLMRYWPNLLHVLRACKESRATDNKKGGDRNGGEGGPRKPRAELIQTMDAVFGEGISSEGIRSCH